MTGTWASPWPSELQSNLDQAIPSISTEVREAAQRKVLRDCPDDFDTILDALGIG